MTLKNPSIFYRALILGAQGLFTYFFGKGIVIDRNIRRFLQYVL